MNIGLIHQNKLKHILIIHPEGNSFNNPSVKCIIDLLIEKGCKVDLRYKNSFAPISSTPGIRLIPYSKTLNYIKKIVSDWFCSWKLAFLITLFEKYFLYEKSYDLIIGVDRHGLIEANILHRLYAIPFIFISFEIMFESETSALYKSLERKASKDVALWVVQDKVRAEQLQRENKLCPTKKFLLPIASTGLGSFKKERLRDTLGISFDKKVAIVIGSMAKWSMTNQILEAVFTWPDEWVLIVHERYGKTFESLKKEFIALKDMQGKKIFISNAASDLVDDMGYILAGISVGIAFYEADFTSRYTGNNLKYLGMSSGKIATYLRYGVPVMLNEIGLYSDEAKLFRFGCVVQQPSQIKEKLEEASQDDYRNNARAYFAKNLDFNIYKDEVFSLFSNISHANLSGDMSTDI